MDLSYSHGLGVMLQIDLLQIGWKLQSWSGDCKYLSIWAVTITIATDRYNFTISGGICAYGAVYAEYPFPVWAAIFPKGVRGEITH